MQTKRVLVVEDEDVIRTTLAEALQDEGYHVATASNGAEALQLVRATEPDAIVLDLMMPVMDGRAFLAACRREQRCAETPVLVLSAHHKLAELAAVELQVDDFIAKPFQLDAVLEAVERLVG